MHGSAMPLVPSDGIFRSFGSRHSLIVSSGLNAGTIEFTQSVCSCKLAMMSSLAVCPALLCRPFACPLVLNVVDVVVAGNIASA